ncbi:MAG: amidase [Gammaproteobacteria bacterium]|nr:amidase [Gammaproteobacteria bacterium]
MTAASAQADLAFRSAEELVRMLRSREIGCLELLEHYLARIERYDPAINAIVVREFPQARERAASLDGALAHGENIGSLCGLPMTIKESFNLRGTPTTWGLPQFRNNVATTNAAAVERLVAAGAIIFGKTNVPPALRDGQSSNEIYGRTNNPWDLGRSPGGSSGGSAAALAAGLTGLELGSDIGSSIRNPAHYCGVFGHKPTYGICPQRGHTLVETLQSVDIAVIGPLGRSATDLELALSIIAGAEGPEADARPLSLPQARRTELKNFRVALVVDDPFAEVDQAVQERLHALGEFLRHEGAEVALGARPNLDSEQLYILYMTLIGAAASARLSDEQFAQLRERARGVTLATRETAIAEAFGATLTHRDWLGLDEERRRHGREWRAFFERFDLLLCPPLSTAAFPHSTVPPQQRKLLVNGHEVDFENQLFWAGFGGMFYLPASVAPIGFTPDGLPVGVQIIGPQFGDLTCLRFARLLEENYQAFVPPPGFARRTKP